MSDAEPKPVPFGPFLLERRLAVGGHAEVFIARPKSGERPAPRLVVKRLLPAAREDGGFEILDQEATLHQAVNHPNVVRVFGAGMVLGEPYLAMEYVEGLDLHRLARRAEAESRRWPPELAVFVARRIALALAAVHSARDPEGRPLHIVHRDVTPSNVYLSLSGDVKLGDFGIARTGAEGPPVSGGGLKGKFGYFSPEQIEGELPDHRSDLFSLMAVLGELLIGQRVFAGGGQLAVLLSIREGDIGPLRAARSSLPAGLFDVCARGLARDPRDRFADATDLANALSGFETAGEAELAATLAEWVTWAADPAAFARTLRGRVADSVARMKAISRSSSKMRAVDPAAVAAIPPSQADSVRETLSRVERADGRVIEGVSFAKLVEMIATGDVTGLDRVELMGAAPCQIREIDDLARHLMPSTTQTTGHQNVLGVPDFAAELSETSLPMVLAKLRRDGETGVLFVERHARDTSQRKEIYLERGRLMHVASTEREELLGEYLVKRNVVARSDLELALARLRQHGGKLGDTLIALGLVDAMDVFRAIRDQGRDRVAAACAWTKGRASLYRGASPVRVEFPLDLDLASPIMAGLLITAGDARALLPGDATKLSCGAFHPSAADRRERGAAPGTLQRVPELATKGLTVGQAIVSLTAARDGARPVRAPEACAALAAARVLGWIEL